MRPRGITSMLYNQDDAMVISKCIGVEIMPGLVYRSAFHGKNLADILQREEREEGSGRSLRQTKAQVEFLLGDIHDTCSSDRVMTQVLSQATVVVCFATCTTYMVREQ